MQYKNQTQTHLLWIRLTDNFSSFYDFGLFGSYLYNSSYSSESESEPSIYS